MHSHTHTHMRTHACSHAHTHSHMHTHTCSHTHTRTHTHTHAHTHTHTAEVLSTYSLMLADGVEPKWASHYLAFHAHLWRGTDGDLDRALELQQEVIKGNPQLKRKTQQLVIKACTNRVCGRSCCYELFGYDSLSLSTPLSLSIEMGREGVELYG